LAVSGDGNTPVWTCGHVNDVVEMCLFGVVFDVVGVIAGKVDTTVIESDTQTV
jgi:hypothetical protein